MRKYLAFAKVGFQVALVYPAPIFFRVLRHASIVALFVLLWGALLQNNANIGGFNLASMTTYYLLVEIVDTFYTNTPARLLGRDVKTGDLNNFLVKPVNYWKYLMSYTVGQELGTSWMSGVAVLGVFVFFPSFVAFPSNLLYFLAFLFLGIGGFLISYQISFTIGTFAFWVSEITHVRQGFSQLVNLLGGRWVPISFFPITIVWLLNVLPFSFLFNFPVRVFLGQIGADQILKGISVEILWILFLIFVGNKIWGSGVKNYEAYGR